MKKTIKNNLLSALSNGSGHDKYRPSDYDMPIIDMIVNEICDPTVKRVDFLLEDETEILRRKLGVYADNVTSKITLQEASYGEITREGVRLKLAIAYNYLIKRIIAGKIVDNKKRMSSLPIPSEYENYSIAKICDTKSRRLLSNGIYTLYDLLSYGKRELLKFDIGETTLQRLCDEVHALGLRFIDELSDDEKRNIVAATGSTVVDNSSLAWINGIDIRTINYLRLREKDTIAGLREYNKSKNGVNSSAIKYANNIGINIRGLENINIGNVHFFTVDEIKEASLNRFEISNKLYNILTSNGFNCMGDIIEQDKKSFYSLRGFGCKYYEELTSLVHKLGFVFSDEAKKLGVYAHELSFLTSELKALRDNLLARYNELLTNQKASGISHEEHRELRDLSSSLKFMRRN